MCTGYYCEPTPLGDPPGVYDPEDPRYKASPNTNDLPTLTGNYDPNCLKTSTVFRLPGHRDCITTQVCATEALPTLTGTKASDCDKTTRVIYPGGGHDYLTTAVCKPTPTANDGKDEPGYDDPVDGFGCSNRRRLDRGYACSVGESGVDAYSPDCCLNGSCGFCEDYTVKPACCIEGGDEACKWTESSIRSSAQAPHDCVIWAWAIQVNLCRPRNFTNPNFLTWNDGCDPLGATVFEPDDIGMRETITMSWTGQSSGCECQVDGVTTPTHVEQVSDDVLFDYKIERG